MSSSSQRAGPNSSSSTPVAVQQLVLRAELHAATVTEALSQYEAALEQLNTHIRSLPSGSPAQGTAIQHFKELLTTAEQLKQQHQSDPQAAEYSWRKAQAKHLAEQAVAADGRGALEEAKGLYFKLLECLQCCYSLEPLPDCQAAIMARFRVYLERAEQLRNMLQQQ